MEDADRTKILLADDHKILRSGLRSLLERHADFKIVAEAEDGIEAVELCKKYSPDVLLIDVSMPNLNGIEAIPRIREGNPTVKIIILSVHSSRRFVSEALKAGADGYLLKNCDFEEMVYAIDSIRGGGVYISPQVANVVRDDYVQFLEEKGDSFAAALTQREREVLKLISEGKNTKEIAFSFNLSVKTVEAHRQHIMEKLNLHSVAALTKYAIREGLTTEE